MPATWKAAARKAPERIRSGAGMAHAIAKSMTEEIAKSIFSKIHAAGGDEACRAFVESKGAEMPAVELSSEEMEALKGGKSLFDDFIDWLI